MSKLETVLTLAILALAVFTLLSAAAIGDLRQEVNNSRCSKCGVMAINSTICATCKRECKGDSYHDNDVVVVECEEYEEEK